MPSHPASRRVRTADFWQSIAHNIVNSFRPMLIQYRKDNPNEDITSQATFLIADNHIIFSAKEGDEQREMQTGVSSYFKSSLWHSIKGEIERAAVPNVSDNHHNTNDPGRTGDKSNSGYDELQDNRIRYLNEQITRLQGQIEKATNVGDKDDLQGQIDNMRTEVDTIKTNQTAIRGDLDETKRTITNIDTRTASMEVGLFELTTSVSDAFSLTNDRIDNVQIDINAKADADTVKVLYDSHTSQIETLRSEARSLRAEITTWQADEATADLNTRETLAELRDLLDSKEAQILEVQSSFETRINAIDARVTANSKLLGSIRDRKNLGLDGADAAVGVGVGALVLL